MNDEIRFNIKEVAAIVGVSPATIRNWEKNELFVAKRDANNYRVFHLNDIEQLKKIKEYSLDQRLNNQAIKKAMSRDISMAYSGLPSALDNPASENAGKGYSKKLISEKWKQIREERNLTLDQVSKDTGISASYLSRIENMNANISLDILNRLSDYYGESIIYFYGDNETGDQYITKKAERDPIDIGLSGVYIESLIKRKKTVMRPALFTVLPNSGQKRLHAHRGEEFIIVTEGEITVTLNTSETYILKEGDSLNFPSQTPHLWYNHSNKICILLWVHSPINAF
ncbi:hypothetical protein LBYZC6_06730 [Lacrimispora brassicae]